MDSPAPFASYLKNIFTGTNMRIKYAAIYILLGLATAFLLWKAVQYPVKVDKEIPAIVLWNDTLLKHLPNRMDTNVLVMDTNNRMLHFSQYIKPVFNHEATIYQDRGYWRMQWFSKKWMTRLAQNDSAVARWEIYHAWRTPDTVKSCKIKLDDIAHTLAQADYVLVLKSQRKMLIKRKGAQVLTLPINMGWAPEGNKQFEGDGKTPEGIYHLDLKATRGDKYYKSFLISYPNATDRMIAKQKGFIPGSGVCIHGTPAERTGRKDWTAGCIALTNPEMDALFDKVASGTVIEIRK